MGDEIKSWNFDDFKNAVTQNLGEGSESQVKKYEKDLKSIFDSAAKHDIKDGNDDFYECDLCGPEEEYADFYESIALNKFQTLVKIGADFVIKHINSPHPQSEEVEPDDFPSLRMTLHTESVRAKDPEILEINIIKVNQNSGYTLGQEIVDKINNIKTFSYSTVQAVEEAIEKITPENAAYVCRKVPEIAKYIDDVFAMGFGLDKGDVFDNVVENLQKQVKNLGLELDITCTKDSTFDEMKKYIKAASDKIAEYDNQKIGNFNKEVKKYNEEAEKLEYANKMMPFAKKKLTEFNNAIKTAASMDPKPEVELNPHEGGLYGKTVKLSNGIKITAEFDEYGKVYELNVKDDKDNDIYYDSSKFYMKDNNGNKIYYFNSKLKLDINYYAVKPYIREIFGQDIEFADEAVPDEVTEEEQTEQDDVREEEQ